MTLLDFHTHRLQATDALISVEPDRFAPEPGKRYAVGLHPWHTAAEDVERQMALLERMAVHPQVAAIGETGLDALRGAPLDVQIELLERHVAVAEAVEKPLVIHTVRTSQQVLKVWRASRRSVPWAIHGFRGNAHVVQLLVDAGFHISFGERFNPLALRAVPAERLLAETDDSPMPIASVVARMAAQLQLPPERLERTVAANLARLLNLGCAK